MISLILASTSLQRKMLLEKYKIPFTLEKSDYEEVMDARIPYQDLAKKLAYGKAQQVAVKHAKEDIIILGADTFVVFKEKYLGKPKSRQEAEKMLTLLSNNHHIVITAYVLIHPRSEKEIVECTESKLTFKLLSREDINNHLDTHTYLDKAGGYAIFEITNFIKTFCGDEEGIIGLPMKKVLRSLLKIDKSYKKYLKE